jgi:hypothetical protein
MLVMSCVGIDGVIESDSSGFSSMGVRWESSLMERSQRSDAINLTGVGGAVGRLLSQEVSLLGAIMSFVIMLGLNGQTLVL